MEESTRGKEEEREENRRGKEEQREESRSEAEWVEGEELGGNPGIPEIAAIAGNYLRIQQLSSS